MFVAKKLYKLLFPPRPFAAEVEQQFLLDYSVKYATRRKLLAVVALGINIGYFLVDMVYALYDPLHKEAFTRAILPLRTLGTGALIISVWLVFRPAIIYNERYATFCGAFGIVTTYLMLLALTYAIPFPKEYFYYYDGMLLVLMFLFGLSKLLVKPVLLLIPVLLFFSALTFNAYDINSVEPAYAQEHLSPMIFLSIFCLMGYLIALEQERTARNTFLRETDLQRAKEESNSNAAALLALKEQSRQQAEQQNRDKSKFMANAAHDLRNVMQPVDNFLEVSQSALMRGDAPQAHEYLQEAIIANKVLCTTVNALLEISGLESGVITVQLSSFDVRQMAAEVIQACQPLAEQRKVTLRLSKPQAVSTIVSSDRQHLKRILANLVVNAIKYADSGKGDAATVAVAIMPHTDHIRLDVIDNGIGIPLAEQENVFKPLYQLHNPERNRDKGIGLGLSIVAATLKLLTDHCITLSSKPGRGSRFRLILPKGKTVALDELEPPPQNLAGNLSGLYVLLIENDALVKRSMVALLEASHAQYEAVSSMSELQTLLLTLEREPDVVVTDYRLADDCTALEVISAITANFGKKLPTLILTGETTDLSTLLPDCKILHKPVVARQLLAEIKQLAQG